MVVLTPRACDCYPPGLRLPFPLAHGCHSHEACGLHYSNCLKLSQLQSALPQPLQKHSTPAAHPFATPCKPITSTHTPRRPFTHGRHCRARMDSSTRPEWFPPWEPQQLPHPPVNTERRPINPGTPSKVHPPSLSLPQPTDKDRQPLSYRLQARLAVFNFSRFQKKKGPVRGPHYRN